MLIYRITSAIYFFLSILSIIWIDEKLWALLILSFIYISLLVLGSSFIQLNFYIKAFNKKDTKDKVVAITFDDGPISNTTSILNLLDKYNAKASFFCVGEKILENPSIIKRIYEANHTIGNHSYYHKNYFPMQPKNTIGNEIEETNKAFESILGVKPKYFRPPFGVTNPLLAKAILASGMSVIGWSIRSLDTTKRSKEKVLDRIISKLAPGKIILLHDSSENIHWILEGLLQYLAEKKYKAISLDQLNYEK